MSHACACVCVRVYACVVGRRVKQHACTCVRVNENAGRGSIFVIGRLLVTERENGGSTDLGIVIVYGLDAEGRGSSRGRCVEKKSVYVCVCVCEG